MRGSAQDSATPYCRCRVLYLGSSVPHASKEGLLGVQEPLRELYPEQGALGARGIDSWLSVWSNGLLLENVDEHRKKVTRFFPIEALHYCAAVRHVKAGSGADALASRFFPLDSPFARTPSANHPPLFAAVLRRTTGIKVLECHAFICKRDMAANALVRCCFHAYADSRFAKGLEPNGHGPAANGSAGAVSHNGSPSGHNGLLGSNSPASHLQHSTGSLYHTLGGSSTTLAEGRNGDSSSPTSKLETASNEDGSSLYNGDENHKVWARGRDDLDGLYQEQGTLRSSKGSRPRQLVAPPPPPPPPPPPSQPLILEEAYAQGRKKPSKKPGKKPAKPTREQAQLDLQQQHQMQMQQAGIYGNGHGHGHHTLGHPGHPGPRQGPPAPPHAHGFHPLGPASRSVAGTLARPAPLLLVPAATLPRKGQQHPGRGLRAIPAAAPIVPVYAPLNVVPPPPSAMYPGGYGTTGNRGRRQHLPEEPALLGLQQRRLAASHADLTAAAQQDMQQQQQRQNSDSPDNDSRFASGRSIGAGATGA